MNNIIVRMTDELPLSVLGLTVPDAEGDYNIYLNSRSAVNRQNEAFWHELRHIYGEDFNRDEAAHIIEEARRNENRQLRNIY